MKKEKTPLNYTRQPFDSSAKSLEYELAAQNIMLVLSRTGNVFRKLTLKEYKDNIKKVDNRIVGSSEAHYMQCAIHYCLSSIAADDFCHTWYNAKIK